MQGSASCLLGIGRGSFFFIKDTFSAWDACLYSTDKFKLEGMHISAIFGMVKECVDYLLWTFPSVNRSWDFLFSPFNKPWTMPVEVRESFGKDIVIVPLSNRCRLVHRFFKSRHVFFMWKGKNKRVFKNKSTELDRITVDSRKLLYAVMVPGIW